MLLKGKNLIVTGGASGIGAACVKRFAEEGANYVLIVDINLEAAEKVAQEISQQTGAKIGAVKANVTLEEDIKRAFDVFRENCDTLHVLLNCAGISNTKHIDEITCEQWDRTMNVNLRSAFLFSREALKMMEAQRYGRIINMASQAGKSGGITVGVDYAVSKAGILNLTKSLAKQAAPYSVTVNSVAPGLIATAMTTTFGYDPETVPLKRIGTPEEVADAVLFVASDLSRYVTGSCIDVNGGILMS